VFPCLRGVPRRPECTETTSTSQSGPGRKQNYWDCLLACPKRGCGRYDRIWTALHSGRGSRAEVSLTALWNLDSLIDMANPV